MLGRFINKIFSPKRGCPPPVLDATSDAATLNLPADRPARPPSLAVPSWNPDDVIMDRYRVESIMSGSMGKVYISEHLGWGVKMAIKSPRPEVLADREGMKRILTEANSWIRMGMHPNVAACYYVLSIKKIPHLFIEYVDGGSLAEWIETGRCRNLRTALSLAIQFCHGMEFTHSHGIIHRDIKPHNILITKNSLLKITDFGILLSTMAKNAPAKNGGALKAGADANATVGFRGTPGYASPEQFRDAHGVDIRTDIFSFGLCLWMMLCGHKPFKNNSIKNPIPKPKPSSAAVVFPSLLNNILKKCVAFDPDARYQNFAELRTALNNAYLAAFNTACPYAELSNIDLRADSLNNRAVSLFELGEKKEAAECLYKALEINDVLPEAIYNLILLKWRSGVNKPARILRQIDAAKKRVAQADWFKKLEAEVRKETLARASGDNLAKRDRYPEFRLCIPRNSLEIFREGQLSLSIQRNILDHLENKRYKQCHEVLMTAWPNNGFKKDKTFNRAYEVLLRNGDKQGIVGAQRFITLKGGGCPATSLAYIPQSRKIVSAGIDGRIIVRDLSVDKQIKVIGEPGLPVRSLVASPEGKQIAVGTEDGAVHLLSPKSGKSFSRTPSHNGPVMSLAFSPDGRSIASGGSDGILKVRKLSGTEKSISIPEGGPIRSILFFKGEDLVTGSEDGKIRFWVEGGNECLRVTEAHALPVVALSPSPDGLRFASASPDRHIKIWDKQTGRCLKSIKGHEEAISSVLFLQDNHTVASGCEDDIIKLWDSENGNCLLTLDGRGDGIYSLADGPRSHTFLAGRKDGAVVLWMDIYRLLFD